MRDLPTPTFAFGPQPRTGLKPVARLLRPRLPAEPAMGAPTAPQPEPAAQPGIVVAWARHQDEVRAAQRLRYDVFAREMGARLASPLEGHDIDLFDDYCEHLLVRDAASQAVIGTYRVLTPAQARRVGSTYSDTEFDLTRLRGLRSRMVELGRSCVHAEYRNGGVIMALWGALGGFMVRNRLDAMIGCASIPMLHNGVISGDVAASIWRQVRERHLAPIEHQVRPRLPLPLEHLDDSLAVEPPALIRGYLRLGTKVLGPPAWDPDFNSADLPMLMQLAELPARYRKHFLGGLMDAPASQLSAFAGEGGRGFRSGQARSAFATAAGVRALAPAVLRDGGWPGPWDGGGGGSEGEADDMARDRPRFRAIFISDLHLGTPGCQAGALLDFLREQESETLYLVGDIVDGWQLRRRWFWPQAHNDVVQKLLRRARKGCRVVFVPGNHDEFARHFLGHSFGGIEVLEDALHVTADGRRLWVTHGDHFDGVIQCAKWLAYVGDRAYELTLRLNRQLNRLRGRLGLPYWSLSAYLKHKVKVAVSYVSDFEEAVAAGARQRGADGVVCGHIHHAEIREIGGVLYCNDGDWVESCSALVEHHDGRLELVFWRSAPAQAEQMRAGEGAVAAAG